MTHNLFKYSLAAAIFFYAGIASAATYYVATNGNDANSCSAAQNINTPKRNLMGAGGGIACLQAGGDKLYVRAGTYTDNISNGSLYSVASPSWPSGTSWTNAITIAAYPGETVTLTKGFTFGDCCQNPVLPQMSYWIFDGFKLNSHDSWNNGLILTNGHVDHLRFINMDITNNYATNAPTLGDWLVTGGNTTGNCVAGGAGDSSGFHEFINIEIHDCGAYGIYWTGHDSLFDRVKVHDVYGYGMHMYHYGVHDVNNNTVRNSEFYNVNSTLRNGGVSPSTGILLSSGYGNQAYNNIVRNVDGGIGAAYGSSGYKIFNNTVYNVTDAYSVSYLDAGGVTFKNNIAYNYGGSAFIDWTGVNPTYSNNLCGSSGDGCTLTGDPKFVNASASDFHLQSTSPAINSGVTLSEVTTDKDGITRPQGSAYDIGAYEYGGTATPPPPPPSTVSLSASPSSITSGQSSTLTWSSTNATSCTASGGWTGTKATSGTQSVSPTSNTTYTLSCTGAGGTATQSTTITVSVVTSGTTYYVATTGNDLNPCTANDQTKARRTVNVGIACLQGGNRLEIKAGSYSAPTVAVPSGSSWTSATYITHYGNDIVTLTPAGSSCFIYGPCSIQRYIIVDGLIFDGLGVGFIGTDHIRYINNEIKNAPGQGVEGYNGSYSEIINNKIHHNGDDTQLEHGIYIGYAGSGNNIVRGNEIYNNAAAGIQFYGNGTASNGDVVEKNIVHDNGLGMFAWDMNGALIANNIFYNNTNGPGISVNRAPGALIYNNTIIGNSSYGIDLSNSSSVQIKNNIIYSNSAGAINDLGSGTIKSNNLCNSGCNINSNPLFVSSTNFQLQSASPAINAGANLSPTVTTDILGVSRPVGSAYDIGAYEYVSGSTTLLGDLNGDKIVNSLDWSLMSAKWLTNDANADLNKDGAVNSLDWSIMSSNWLKTI